MYVVDAKKDVPPIKLYSILAQTHLPLVRNLVKLDKCQYGQVVRHFLIFKKL